MFGKALAGWPALSMLASVKLLFAMFDHESKDDQRTTVRDDQRTVPDDQRTSGIVPDVPEIVRASGRDDAAQSATVLADRPADPTASAPPAAAPGGAGHPAAPVAPVDVRTVLHPDPGGAGGPRDSPRLLACRCRGTTLPDVMRDAGHGVPNERASLPFKILKAEQDMTTIGPASVRSHSDDLDPPSEVVA